MVGEDLVMEENEMAQVTVEFGLMVRIAGRFDEIVDLAKIIKNAEEMERTISCAPRPGIDALSKLAAQLTSAANALPDAKA